MKETKTTTMVIYNGNQKSRQAFVDGEAIEKSDPETGAKTQPVKPETKPETKPAPEASKPTDA